MPVNTETSIALFCGSVPQGRGYGIHLPTRRPGVPPSTFSLRPQTGSNDQAREIQTVDEHNRSFASLSCLKYCGTREMACCDDCSPRIGMKAAAQLRYFSPSNGM